MGTYLVTWEANMSFFPTDPKERASLMMPMADRIKQNIKKGTTLSWGSFIGGGAGYSVVKGSADEINQLMQSWVPYFRFDVREVFTIEEVEQSIKELAE